MRINRPVYYFILVFWTINCLTTSVIAQLISEIPDKSTVLTPYTAGNLIVGTISATFNNIARLNKLLQKENTPETEAEIISILLSIDQVIPALHALGMFDLFEPVQWMGHGEQIGRVVALSLYFKHYPEKDTANITKKIASLYKIVNSPSIKELFHSYIK